MTEENKTTFNLSVTARIWQSEIQFYFNDLPAALFELIPLKAKASFTKPPSGWYKEKYIYINRKKFLLVFYQGKDGKP